MRYWVRGRCFSNHLLLAATRSKISIKVIINVKGNWKTFHVPSSAVFGLPVTVPSRSPVLRRAGSKHFLGDTGENQIQEGFSVSLGSIEMKTGSIPSLGAAAMPSPLFLWRFKISWDSVMRMSVDLRDLFLYEAFLYFNPLLLVTMMIWLWGVNLWVFAESSVNYANIFDLDRNHLTHWEIWKLVLAIIATAQMLLGYLIDANPIQSKAYEVLLKAQEAGHICIRQHQAELARQKNEETARRLAGGGPTSGDGRGNARASSDLVAYKNINDIPSSREPMIQVDQKNEAYSGKIGIYKSGFSLVKISVLLEL